MPRKRKIEETTAEDVIEPGPSRRRATRQKRAKRTVAPDAPVEEKRLAKFKPACPQNIQERVERVMTQRFFMIDRQRVEGELREEFKVLGSTGNVYTVKIDHLPKCDCPDAFRGNHCKHILFVFLKVLAVPQSSNLYYQKALLSSELESIFANAPAAPNSVLNRHAQAAYSKAIGRPNTEEESELDKPTDKRRKIEEDDDCPICYEGIHGVNEKLLVFCHECGNAVHKECFQQWEKSSRPDVTCVYCRTKWVSESRPVAGSSTSVTAAEGYLNLGAVAGLSPVRDRSSYHQFSYVRRRQY